MFIFWFLGSVLAIALVVWALLSAVTSRGGQRAGDAARIAGGVIDQTKAFRGDSPTEGEAWDGIDRLKTGPGDPGG